MGKIRFRPDIRKNFDKFIFLLIIIGVVMLYSCLPVIFPPESSIIDDSLEYAAQAESGSPLNWFHPHHLLNNAFHRAIWVVLGGDKLPWRIIHLMRWTSHLSMGLALAFFYLISLRMGSNRLKAILLVLFLSVGCSFWVFGSVSEVVAPSLAMFLAVIWGLFYRCDNQPPSLLKIGFWGALYGLSITWNQIDIIYLPALWLGFMGFERKIRLKAVFTFTAVAFLWVIFSYLVVIFLVRGASNWDDIYSFITRYASWGIWGKGNLETLPTSVRSLLLTQSFSFLRWELTFNGIFAILASSSTILVLLGGIWGWVSTLEKGKDWKLSWGWMAATSVIAVVFINWWQADGWDFWVLPWTLVMLGWAKLKTPNKYITSASLAAFIIIIGLFNLNRLVLPRTEETANPYYDVLITLKNNQESNCYELLTANPHLWRYAYYWGRITNAEFIATESDGNFSSESQKKITRRLLAYNASSEDRPLLVDKPIHDYLISSIAIKPVLSGFVNQNTKPVAQATFEGIDLDIYKIQKP